MFPLGVIEGQRQQNKEEVQLSTLNLGLTRLNIFVNQLSGEHGGFVEEVLDGGGSSHQLVTRKYGRLNASMNWQLF